MTLRMPGDVKWTIVGILACICVPAWLAMAAGFLGVKFSLAVWTGIVVAAAVSTEALFWAFAAALGLTAIQARHRILAKARGMRGRGSSRGGPRA